MIGLDTNVLVRLFVDDEPDQARRARRFVGDRCTEASPGFVDRVALCEMVWVLERRFGYDRANVAQVVERLLSAREIRIEDAPLAQQALSPFAAGTAGFVDALMAAVNRDRGCTTTMTFDRRAARLSGVTEIP